MKKHIVLIVEDKKELQTFMDALNEIKGSFQCTYAASAKQALEMLQYTQPDFIFVDYHLNKVNGLQLLSVIRNEPKLSKIKVFIYSDNISEELNKMARILGAAGCIERPATIARLIHEFKAIFAGDLMPDYAFLKRD